MGEKRAASRVLAAALLVALVVGALSGALLGVWTAQLNEIGAPAEIAALSLQFTGLFGLGAGLGLGGLALLALALGLRPGARFFAASALGAIVLLNALLRFHLTIQPFSVTPHLSAVGLGQLVGAIAGSALVFAALLRVRGGGSAVLLFAAVCLFAGLEAFQRWHERPLRRDLERELEPLVRGAGRPFEPRAEGRFEGAKLVVLGIDGLGVEVLLPILRRGEMPNLAWLLDHSAYGYLATLRFTISPVIWETISSGQPAGRHRIGHHAHWRFAGVANRVYRLPALPIADNTVLGIRRLVTLTAPFAPWERVYHDSTDAGAARVWEVLDRNAYTVGLYHWMNTSPVSRVRGFMKGYEPAPPREWPPGLEADLPELPPVESGLDYERALWERFVELSLEHRPQVLFYYTHFADAANHWNWKQDVVGPGLFYAGWRQSDFEPGPEILDANRLVDSMIGDALARLPEDATLVLLSDHGFEFIGYEHDHGPPGVLVAYGPEVRAGRLEGATVYDIAPTLLHLLGVPVARDMPGRVLPLWRAGSPLERPPESVASWGDAAAPVEVGQASDDEIRETERYLRSLGYVN